jgi:hypothetical protein
LLTWLPHSSIISVFILTMFQIFAT